MHQPRKCPGWNPACPVTLLWSARNIKQVPVSQARTHTDMRQARKALSAAARSLSSSTSTDLHKQRQLYRNPNLCQSRTQHSPQQPQKHTSQSTKQSTLNARCSRGIGALWWKFCCAVPTHTFANGSRPMPWPLWALGLPYQQTGILGE